MGSSTRSGLTRETLYELNGVTKRAPRHARAPRDFDTTREKLFLGQRFGDQREVLYGGKSPLCGAVGRDAWRFVDWIEHGGTGDASRLEMRHTRVVMSAVALEKFFPCSFRERGIAFRARSVRSESRVSLPETGAAQRRTQMAALFLG